MPGIGKGLCRLCQPIIRGVGPVPYRMAPIASETVSGHKTALTAAILEASAGLSRERFIT
jgi:hypothetical protein